MGIVDLEHHVVLADHVEAANAGCLLDEAAVDVVAECGADIEFVEIGFA